MATHARILAGKILWTEKPGGLHVVHGVARVRHNWAHTCTHTYTHTQSTFPVPIYLRSGHVYLCSPPSNFSCPTPPLITTNLICFCFWFITLSSFFFFTKQSYFISYTFQTNYHDTFSYNMSSKILHIYWLYSSHCL